jgi:hypothetical protein
MKMPDIIDYTPRFPYNKAEIETKIKEIEAKFPESEEKTSALKRLREKLEYLDTGKLPEMRIL